MKLNHHFFEQDALELAPQLLGKNLVRKFDDGTVRKFGITEVEVYRGEEDLACHCSKGKTERTKVMYDKGGLVYVYLIYGMYWLFNIVTGETEQPQAILIRGLDATSGPGRVGRLLQLDKSFYGEDLTLSDRMWLENGVENVRYETSPRIGIDYAGPEWIEKPWRFVMK